MITNEEIVNITNSITVSLSDITGDTWIADTNPKSYVQFIHTNNAHFAIQAINNRLVIETSLPSDLCRHHYGTSSRTTVNPKRPALSIAKDIVRKLLDDAIQMVEKAQKVQIQHNKDMEATKKAVNALSPELLELGYWNGDTSTRAKLSNAQGYPYTKVHIDSGKVSSMEIRSITVNQAKKIMELIKNE